MNKLKKDVVIVTGAANGIGRAVARAYGENGCAVVLADMDEVRGEQVASEWRAEGHDVCFVRTDVTQEKDIIHLVELTRSTYGTINVLINNAGISEFKPLLECSVDDWDRVMNTNVRSTFLCSKEASKVMRENEGGGAIVNIASTRAIMSEPHSEAYAASKGGIVALTHALAASLSEYNITVNAVSPGWIETGNYSELREVDHQQHFAKRVGKPNDVAKACMYLTAADNDFVTGMNLIVDGGMTRKMIYEE
ncbi:SDR family NAD(P)-dependent oxidoreductase [Alkalihalobacterium chitinilyticum]|uniref:SDR family oxidoreductase n=1 Tax=Alkalihalobacterium chitinilyticum TaxID=2980103 RepID=A0ABT5VD62_9BACI|nr:glucose 1-dehydrogenase [Alkalihalobacterium chitinilyticum]MDE5413392.1 SDR family oxidoreductase [Alkalihalobacterium chitinilyticum]